MAAAPEELRADIYPNQEQKNLADWRCDSSLTAALLERLARGEGLADYAQVKRFTLREDESPKATTRSFRRFVVEASLFTHACRSSRIRTERLHQVSVFSRAELSVPLLFRHSSFAPVSSGARRTSRPHAELFPIDQGLPAKPAACQAAAVLAPRNRDGGLGGFAFPLERVAPAQGPGPVHR